MTLDKKTQFLIDFKVLDAMKEYKQYDKDLSSLILNKSNISELRKRAETFREYLDKFTQEEITQVAHLVQMEIIMQKHLCAYYN